MARGKGRNRSAVSISLFSFQDIITSLSGIMILLVLLISLDLVIRQMSDGLLSDPSTVPSKFHHTSPEQSGLKQQAGNSDLIKALLKTAENMERLKVKEAELRNRLSNLEKERDALSLKQVISLIPEKGSDQMPILIQCSKDEILRMDMESPFNKNMNRNDYSNRKEENRRSERQKEKRDDNVFSDEKKSNTGGVYKRYPADEVGLRLFIRSLESMNKSHEYILLMIKPSAANYAMALVRQIQQMGVDVGFDAMREDQSISFGNTMQ